jgi:hypothetical protein
MGKPYHEWTRITGQFLNGAGAIRWKTYQDKMRSFTGSTYYNYKNFHSILQADRKFITVDIGDYSQSNDGGIFKEFSFNKLLVASGLNLPNQSYI